MSAYELSFADKSFEAVMAFALFQHISRRTAGKVLAEIKRVLKPEKRALVTIVLGDGEIMFKSKRHNCGRILITKWHTRDFVEATEQTGLSVSSCEEFINTSSNDELGHIAILNLLRKEQ